MTVANGGIWVLGYGSLIYKPPPHYTHRIPAVIYGFMRRFWQSSVDHRGTPESPGRVVTLVPFQEIQSDRRFLNDYEMYENRGIKVDPERWDAHDLKTIGVVYYIPADKAAEVKEYLDVREQNGYTLHEVEVHLDLSESDSQDQEMMHAIRELPKHNITGKKVLTTNVYIGTVINEAFVGPETIQETASVIATNVGPSGTNFDYLRMLCESMQDMNNEKDVYLEALFDEVKRLRKYNALNIENK